MSRPPPASRLAVLSLLVVASGMPVLAQTASEHFPNDDGGANVQVVGTMELTLKQQGLGAPIKTTVNLVVGETGQQVAVDSASALCLQASTGPLAMVCDDPTCTFPIGGSKIITCTSGAVGFSITRLNTQVSFTVAPESPEKIQALNCRTTSGNTHGDDLLERVIVRLEPDGVNGNVTFSVHHVQGGQNPRTFTVNTTGLADGQLHNAIAQGYNGLGLGLTALARPGTTCLASGAPETVPGAFVVVTYSPDTQTSLIDFEVDGLRSGGLGQNVIIETSGNPIASSAQCPIADFTFGADKTTMTWSYPAGCALPAVYDVVRADLACHCNNCTTCLQNDGAALLGDATPPGPGLGFWYLARVSGGTWNGLGTTQVADNDVPALAPSCVP